MKHLESYEWVISGFTNRPRPPTAKLWAQMIRDDGFAHLLTCNQKDWGVIGDMMVVAKEVLEEG